MSWGRSLRVLGEKLEGREKRREQGTQDCSEDTT